MWVDIKGYEGIYQVSTFGNVRSLGSVRLIKGTRQFYPMKLLKQCRINSGYLIVCIWKNGEKKNELVHRIMADNFLSNNDPNKNQVNHKNGIKTDNRLENLEWCSRSENLKHAIRLGLANPPSVNKVNAKLRKVS